jgi:hypothetical protein
MKSLRERAEERMDELGFTAKEKEVIFYDWSEGDGHLEWLLEAPEEEIRDWLGVVGED